MSSKKTHEEKRAALIIKYRKLKVNSEEREGSVITYHLSRDEDKFVMRVLLGLDTVGIAYVRDLKDLVDEVGAKQGIIVTNGKYTYSARSNASILDVELIPPTLPVFDIFKHDLVPLAELLGEEERKKLEGKYHAELYQYPWINSSDPVSIILGAKPGDVLKITSKSATAGAVETYRYVV